MNIEPGVFNVEVFIAVNIQHSFYASIASYTITFAQR